ncbi:MAG: hypothetical protein Dasosvirus4_3 [Dasosvirus sp.]|uniref:Uncharacterized protein n=1 Tax=Dasosvirus sp. TaxID=2487764 RepID=A0A3G4ZRE0_9VIRU|nr:MAG: hypothetical protein Dasosvirus4_3 [Dasosvirus sp.]
MSKRTDKKEITVITKKQKLNDEYDETKKELERIQDKYENAMKTIEEKIKEMKKIESKEKTDFDYSKLRKRNIYQLNKYDLFDIYQDRFGENETIKAQFLMTTNFADPAKCFSWNKKKREYEQINKRMYNDFLKTLLSFKSCAFCDSLTHSLTFKKSCKKFMKTYKKIFKENKYSIRSLTVEDMHNMDWLMKLYVFYKMDPERTTDYNELTESVGQYIVHRSCRICKSIHHSTSKCLKDNGKYSKEERNEKYCKICFFNNHYSSQCFYRFTNR